MAKCRECICFKCCEEFSTDPWDCSYSDCGWCKNEEETYTDVCSKYIAMGGKYDN